MTLLLLLYGCSSQPESAGTITLSIEGEKISEAEIITVTPTREKLRELCEGYSQPEECEKSLAQYYGYE